MRTTCVFVIILCMAGCVTPDRRHDVEHPATATAQDSDATRARAIADREVVSAGMNPEEYAVRSSREKDGWRFSYQRHADADVGQHVGFGGRQHCDVHVGDDGSARLF